jgi:hypothetical protein
MKGLKQEIGESRLSHIYTSSVLLVFGTFWSNWWFGDLFHQIHDFFQINLRPCRHISISFNWGYLARSVNNTKFLWHGSLVVQFHKTFFGWIYSPISVLPQALTEDTLLGAYKTLKKVLWNWSLMWASLVRRKGRSWAWATFRWWLV